MYILCNIVQGCWYVRHIYAIVQSNLHLFLFMEHSWNKKNPPKPIPCISTLLIQVLTKLPPPKAPPCHTPPSPRSIERPTLFCIMSIFQSLCSIECPTLFCTMSVFPDFGSDIFLLHIIYSLFSVLFCLHYTVINLLYRKFT